MICEEAGGGMGRCFRDVDGNEWWDTEEIRLS